MHLRGERMIIPNQSTDNERIVYTGRRIKIPKKKFFDVVLQNKYELIALTVSLTLVPYPKVILISFLALTILDNAVKQMILPQANTLWEYMTTTQKEHTYDETTLSDGIKLRGIIDYSKRSSKHSRNCPKQAILVVAGRDPSGPQRGKSHRRDYLQKISTNISWKGCDVYCFSHRGTKHSEGYFPTFNQLINDQNEIATTLIEKYGKQNVQIVGYGMGDVIAQIVLKQLEPSNGQELITSNPRINNNADIRTKALISENHSLYPVIHAVISSCLAFMKWNYNEETFPERYTFSY